MEDQNRTLAQNNALHLLFTQLADELNSKGFDIPTIIGGIAGISWNPYLVKELWRIFQERVTGKKSTTKLSKQEEIDKIYDELNKYLIETTRGQVSLPAFPSIESLIENE